MPKRSFSMPAATALSLVAAMSLAACDGPATPPPLEGATIGAPFQLTGTDGQTVRWSDFDGEYRMVYFGYTWCPDVCPFDLTRMMTGYRQFAAEEPELAAKVQPIFITVDPERDTPEKVGEFVANFGDNLIGLTGTEEQIAKVANDFAVGRSRGPDDPNVGYLMQHLTSGFLFGPDGEPIAIVPTNESAEAVAAELEQWVS